MAGPPNILLIGLRASGKSTVGRRAAAALGRPFVDLDVLALARFSETSVTDVFERHGEPAWRAAECAALEEVVEDSGRVVALGGGTPCHPSARACIEREQRHGRALVVLLDAPVEDLIARLEMEPGDRPLLAGAETREGEVRRLRAERGPVYAAIADLTLAGGLDALVDAVVRAAG